MKNKYQIITSIALLLTACGENPKEEHLSGLQENTTQIVDEQASNQDVQNLPIGIQDTLAIEDEIVSEMDTAEIIVLDKVESISDEQADEIIETLHSDNNNSNNLELQKGQKDTPTATPEVVAPLEETVNETLTIAQTKIDHQKWDALVRKNVSSSGKVNYTAFKTQKVQVQEYLDQLAAQKPASDWTKNEKLAYWINAYNAFTVKLIIDNYPTSSITKLKGGKPWDDKFINLDGTKYSLGEIENDILRKMHEPRIHFAINCASGSCPNILNRAFVADKMASQLLKVTNSFLNDPTKNDFSGKKIKISELFNWYANDFNGGDIIGFLNQYRTEQLDASTKIEFLPYDWSLNE